jgi:predicted RNase H-like HicB family nuclease
MKPYVCKPKREVKMNKKLDEQAKLLAELPYTLKIARDITVDGKNVFLTSHPELIGCMAQGDEVDKAVDNLREVTYEYILSLLEDKLPVPMPLSRQSTTGYARATITGEVKGNKPFGDILVDVIQPTTREDISTAECVSC